jgi:hypothetical protein
MHTMKTKCRTINGNDIELTDKQWDELRRDGIVIVGDRIIRTASYIGRMNKSAKAEITKKLSDR